MMKTVTQYNYEMIKGYLDGTNLMKEWAAKGKTAEELINFLEKSKVIVDQNAIAYRASEIADFLDNNQLNGSGAMLSNEHVIEVYLLLTTGKNIYVIEEDADEPYPSSHWRSLTTISEKTNVSAVGGYPDTVKLFLSSLCTQHQQQLAIEQYTSEQLQTLVDWFKTCLPELLAALDKNLTNADTKYALNLLEIEQETLNKTDTSVIQTEMQAQHSTSNTNPADSKILANQIRVRRLLEALEELRTFSLCVQEGDNDREQAYQLYKALATALGQTTADPLPPLGLALCEKILTLTEQPAKDHLRQTLVSAFTGIPAIPSQTITSPSSTLPLTPQGTPTVTNVTDTSVSPQPPIVNVTTTASATATEQPPIPQVNASTPANLACRLRLKDEAGVLTPDILLRRLRNQLLSQNMEQLKPWLSLDSDEQMYFFHPEGKTDTKVPLFGHVPGEDDGKRFEWIIAQLKQHRKLPTDFDIKHPAVDTIDITLYDLFNVLLDSVPAWCKETPSLETPTPPISAERIQENSSTTAPLAPQTTPTATNVNNTSIAPQPPTVNVTTTTPTTSTGQSSTPPARGNAPANLSYRLELKEETVVSTTMALLHRLCYQLLFKNIEQLKPWLSWDSEEGKYFFHPAGKPDTKVPLFDRARGEDDGERFEWIIEQLKKQGKLPASFDIKHPAVDTIDITLYDLFGVLLDPAPAWCKAAPSLQQTARPSISSERGQENSSTSTPTASTPARTQTESLPAAQKIAMELYSKGMRPAQKFSPEAKQEALVALYQHPAAPIPPAKQAIAAEMEKRICKDWNMRQYMSPEGKPFSKMSGIGVHAKKHAEGLEITCVFKAKEGQEKTPAELAKEQKIIEEGMVMTAVFISAFMLNIFKETKLWEHVPAAAKAAVANTGGWLNLAAVDNEQLAATLCLGGREPLKIQTLNKDGSREEKTIPRQPISIADEAVLNMTRQKNISKRLLEKTEAQSRPLASAHFVVG